MHSLTQTMEFARASVVCVFLSYNKKTLAEISVEKFLWRFLCCKYLFCSRLTWNTGKAIIERTEG